MAFGLQPTLANELIILRPLQWEDYQDLYAVASDPLLWEQHPASDRYQEDVFQALFKDAMSSGGALAIIDKQSGDIIGSTRFHELEKAPNAIEIGWTFLSRKYWGGMYNTSMKKLMINYAFQYVDHVLFYVGSHNFRSQKAVEKLGGERITTFGGKQLDTRPTASVIYMISKDKWQHAFT